MFASHLILEILAIILGEPPPRAALTCSMLLLKPESSRARAHYRDSFGCLGGGDGDFGLVASQRIDHAAGAFVLEDQVQTGLIAGDASVDRLRCIVLGFVYPLCIGE